MLCLCRGLWCAHEGPSVFSINGSLLYRLIKGGASPRPTNPPADTNGGIVLGNGGQVRKSTLISPPRYCARQARVRPLYAGAGQALVLSFPYRAVRRAHGTRRGGTREARKGGPSRIGPWRWSTEPYHAGKAGIQQKELANSHEHTHERGKTTQLRGEKPLA
jgi:hypothetical protein